MSYDSRLFLIKRVEFDTLRGEHMVMGEEVAKFNMCVMEHTFLDLFKEEIDYDLYFSTSQEDEATREDCYGAVCKHASVKEVRDWLREEVKRDDYRRLAPLLAFLETIDESQWSEGTLQVVHYGY